MAIRNSIATKFFTLKPLSVEYPPNPVWGEIKDLAQLRFLCSVCTEKVVLEIGTFRGVTTYNLSKYAKEVVTIDIDNQTRDDCPYPQYEVGSWFKDRGVRNIKQIIGDTQQLDFRTLNTQFDVIFIDGEHTEQGCTNDFTKSLQVLKSDGVIVIDDYGPYQSGVTLAIDKLSQQHTFYKFPDVHEVCFFGKDFFHD
jgi:spermidine synthase